MAVRRLEINGHSLNQLYVTGDFIIPSFNVETEIQEVKGRPGAIKRRRNIKPYTFDIEVIYSNRDNSLTGKEILDKVVDFVNHGDDEARIRITDQDFFWYGYIDGPIEMPTLVNGYAEFTLTIVLTDPYKYSNAIYKNTAIADSVDVVNEGTAATDFTLEATALEPSTMFMVSKGVDDYFMIGQPEDALKTTVNASPYVIKDHMTNIVPWTTIQTGRIDDIVSGGTVKGRFDTGGQGSNFRAFDFGQPDNNREWHGPGIMRSLSDTVEDFSAIAKIKLFDRGTGVGKGFVHLVDEAGKLVCSFGLLDGHQSYSRVRFVVRLYDAYGTPTQILDYPGASSAAYKDDFIFCKVVRRGEVFELYTWKNFKDENGRIRIGSRYNTTFTDKDHKFQQPIRQVYLYAATYSRYDTLPVYFDYLGLVKLRGADDDETPFILQPGDVVNIDSKSNVVTINDEPRTDLKDFASNYFSLEPGLSTLLVEPQETFDTTVHWFDKYL